MSNEEKQIDDSVFHAVINEHFKSVHGQLKNFKALSGKDDNGNEVINLIFEFKKTATSEDEERIKKDVLATIGDIYFQLSDGQDTLCVLNETRHDKFPGM